MYPLSSKRAWNVRAVARLDLLGRSASSSQFAHCDESSATMQGLISTIEIRPGCRHQAAVAGERLFLLIAYPPLHRLRLVS